MQCRWWIKTCLLDMHQNNNIKASLEEIRKPASTPASIAFVPITCAVAQRIGFIWPTTFSDKYTRNQYTETGLQEKTGQPQSREHWTSHYQCRVVGVKESQAAVNSLIFLEVFLQRETIQKSRDHLNNEVNSFIGTCCYNTLRWQWSSTPAIDSFPIKAHPSCFIPYIQNQMTSFTSGNSLGPFQIQWCFHSCIFSHGSSSSLAFLKSHFIVFGINCLTKHSAIMLT